MEVAGKFNCIRALRYRVVPVHRQHLFALELAPGVMFPIKIVVQTDRRRSPSRSALTLDLAAGKVVALELCRFPRASAGSAPNSTITAPIRSPRCGPDPD
jgi:hypothetical protein